MADASLTCVANQKKILISCKECGSETERNSNYQRYCRPCARIVNLRNCSASSMRRHKERKVEKRFKCRHYGTGFKGRRGKNFYCSPGCWRSFGIQGRISSAMRTGINRGMLKGQKSSKKTFDILGFTLAEFLEHIERQFLPGMSWANYRNGEAGWHIDHRVPLTAFKYKTFSCPEFKAAWALTNLQPLWDRDNRRKNDRRTFLL